MKATAIVPVKRFARAKQRLLERLDRPARAAIVKAMLADVLAAVSSATGVERVIVVSGEPRAERIALRHAQRTTTPLEVLRDPRDSGHSHAATLGIVRAKALGADCVALLAGDCPLLVSTELDAALESMLPGRVAVVPDRHGTGTNALLMAPADAIGPAFGEDSRERHLERAGRAGYDAASEELDSLALDLDTAGDLDALVAVLDANPGRARSTAAELAALGLLPGRHR